MNNYMRKTQKLSSQKISLKKLQKGKIDDHPIEGFMVSDESDINNPNIDTDGYSVASTQHTDSNRYSKNSAEAINGDDKLVTSINK